MELVTGRKGSPHVTSQQDRMLNQGIFGQGAYILNTGQNLEPQVQTSNEIRIRDGAIMAQGALGCVKVNTYDSVTIQNGNQGMKRIDLICWQYSYDAEQDVESAEWVVIQGTPVESDPQQPTYTSGNIQEGDALVQIPVFAVNIDGINVTGVDILLDVAMDMSTANAYLAQLNENSIIEMGKNLQGDSNTLYSYIKYANGILEVWGRSAFTATTLTQQTAVVQFPAVDFIDTDSMNVLLTMNRNGTLADRIIEANNVGNITRTTHSFTALCGKNNSNYGINFSFIVKGFWK